MPKINREEYEKIKLLPDYDWNWIAREKTGKILSFTNKPTKTDEVWKDKQTRLWFNYKDSQLFQFIQWEDEEPYNIQELIEEYEKDYKGSWEHAIEFSKEMRREGEETEVKNIEWLKEIISLERKLLSESLMGAQETEVERIFNDGKEHGLIFASNRINQLDEPEVSSQEWISEKSIDTHVDTVNGEIQVTSIPDDLKELLVPNQEITFEQAYEKLREESILSEKSFDYYWNCINDNVEIDEPGNLLVPKQELPVIPKFVAEAIEEDKECGYDVYESIDLIIGTNGGGLPSISDWVARNIDKYARAYLDGFTVEEEQKYYAKIKGHEQIGSNDKYWNYEISTEELDIGDNKVHPDVLAEYMLKATKDEWANLGINKDNADFVKVEEMEQ